MATDSPKAQPGALARELARRGKTQSDLERVTGLSRSVLAKVNRGDNVSERTLGTIGRALHAWPVIDEVDALLGVLVPKGLTA